MSTTSISFVSDSDIPEDTSSIIKPAKTGYTLWRESCRHSRIKNLTTATHSLCEYIWEVILCMILVNDGRLGLDI